MSRVELSWLGDQGNTPPGDQWTPITQTNPLPIANTGCGLKGIAPVISSAAESGHVLKNAPGNLYNLNVASLSGSAALILVFNAAAVPSNGAVTPTLVYNIPANGNLNVGFPGGIPEYFNTGIAVAISSVTTNPFSLALVSNGAFFNGAVA